MILSSLLSSIATFAEEGHEENVGQFIIHHVKNSNEWNILGYHLQLPQFEPFSIFGITINMSITNHVVMLWVAALFLILLILKPICPGLIFSSRFCRVSSKLIPSGSLIAVAVPNLFAQSFLPVL